MEWEVAATTALRLLKTGPSAESSSDAISTTPLSFSGGVEAGDAWTAVRGTATMGVEGVGEGAAATDMGAGGAEAPAALDAPWRQQASPVFPRLAPYLRQGQNSRGQQSNTEYKGKRIRMKGHNMQV